MSRPSLTTVHCRVIEDKHGLGGVEANNVAVQRNETKLETGTKRIIISRCSLADQSAGHVKRSEERLFRYLRPVADDP